MKTATATKTKRLLRLVVAFRQQVAKVKSGGLTDRDQIVQAVAKRTKRMAIQHFDDIHCNFIETNAMSDKRAAHHGVEVLTGQFVLSELFTVHHKEETLFLERGELTLDDGDQIARQKDANIVAAIRAKKEWDWEWKQIIRPLLVANPGWIYRNAYEHLLKNGGVPVPPSFDDE